MSAMAFSPVIHPGCAGGCVLSISLRLLAGVLDIPEEHVPAGRRDDWRG